MSSHKQFLWFMDETINPARKLVYVGKRGDVHQTLKMQPHEVSPTMITGKMKKVIGVVPKIAKYENF